MPTLEARFRNLCQRFIGGAMTAQQFVDAFFPHWREYRDSEWALSESAWWVERMMTAADCYDYPDPRLYLSEDALRSEIAEHFKLAL